MLEKEVILIALIPGKIETLLGEFKEEVCRNPDADLAPYAAELRKMAKKQEKALIRTLMLNLYAQDTQSLMRDIAKLAALGTAQAPPSHQRAAMLHAFMEIAFLYFDFSELLAMYDKVEDTCKDGASALDT